MWLAYRKPKTTSESHSIPGANQNEEHHHKEPIRARYENT